MCGHRDHTFDQPSTLRKERRDHPPAPAVQNLMATLDGLLMLPCISARKNSQYTRAMQQDVHPQSRAFTTTAREAEWTQAEAIAMEAKSQPTMAYTVREYFTAVP